MNARLRYFDPARKSAGVPEDVGVLVSEMTSTKTVVTLVNLSHTETRTVIVQGGAYGEHQLESITLDETTTPINSPLLHKGSLASEGTLKLLSRDTNINDHILMSGNYEYLRLFLLKDPISGKSKSLAYFYGFRLKAFEFVRKGTFFERWVFRGFLVGEPDNNDRVRYLHWASRQNSHWESSSSKESSRLDKVRPES